MQCFTFCGRKFLTFASFCPLHIPKIVNNCKLNGSYFLKNITKYTIVNRNGHRLGLFILFCDRLTADMQDLSKFMLYSLPIMSIFTNDQLLRYKTFKHYRKMERGTLVFIDCKFIFLASIQDKKLEKLCKKTRKSKCNPKDKK